MVLKYSLHLSAFSRAYTEGWESIGWEMKGCILKSSRRDNAARPDDLPVNGRRNLIGDHKFSPFISDRRLNSFPQLPPKSPTSYLPPFCRYARLRWYSLKNRGALIRSHVRIYPPATIHKLSCRRFGYYRWFPQGSPVYLETLWQ